MRQRHSSTSMRHYANVWRLRSFWSTLSLYAWIWGLLLCSLRSHALQESSWHVWQYIDIRLLSHARKLSDSSSYCKGSSLFFSCALTGCVCGRHSQLHASFCSPCISIRGSDTSCLALPFYRRHFSSAGSKTLVSCFLACVELSEEVWVFWLPSPPP